MKGKVNLRSSKGTGFLTLLCLLFIALKLTGHITWSWFWILSPLLIPFIIGIIVILIIAYLTTKAVFRHEK